VSRVRPEFFDALPRARDGLQNTKSISCEGSDELSDQPTQYLAAVDIGRADAKVYDGP